MMTELSAKLTEWQTSVIYKQYRLLFSLPNGKNLPPVKFYHFMFLFLVLYFYITMRFSSILHNRENENIIIKCKKNQQVVFFHQDFDIEVILLMIIL